MYEYRATLRRIIDSDTVDVDIDLGFGIVYANQRIRLYAIDGPESRTRNLEEKRFGKLATQFLIDNLPTTFTLRTRLDGKGKFGRILGELICYYPEYDREVSLNQVMIDKHLVVAYHGQSKKDVADEHRKNWEILYESGIIERVEF
jgi:micrococcal nuclease